jgi:alkanesulfonate monooxygenase SsuD/methylene tetrahydromethanopterin reductase-like flavin-dependent oxidoreductase (luciferase family)
MVTERLKLASGVAIASTRSPFETAMTAMDADRISEGRFILGMGASLDSWVEGMHGVPYRKPLSRLKETVRAIRYINANAHKGLEPFEGEFYNADFAEFQVTEPPVREAIPIWTAALRECGVMAAGEMSDGLIGHPMWSLAAAQRLTSEQLVTGLERSGRTRGDIHVNLWVWTSFADDMAMAIDNARPTMAFYGALAMYKGYFAEHGFGDVAVALTERISEGDLAGAARLVPDEMVRTFVACGTIDDVQIELEDRWKIADSICLVPPPWGVDLELTLNNQIKISELVAGQA